MQTTLPIALLLSAALMFVAAIAADSDDAGKQPADSLDRDYASELPRIPPVAPKEALATFEVQPGFRIEQLAAEPLVTDPVAMAFDEHGRLFVVEMRGYSEDGEENLGRVRVLTDTNRDGRFDESQVFVEDLAWPTAVICYGGGAFIGVAPDILYCQDTDRDGKADLRRVVFNGFGRGNVQGLLNSFRWGLDNRVHGATSSSGASIRRPDQPDAKPVELRGRDFAFDPRTLELSPASGGGQHGMSFDVWGNKFVCSNSNHAQAVLFDDRYIARNPYLAAPGARVTIATDGPQAAVFRTSPIEPWRIVRTRLRVQGLVPGPVEGGGTPAGYFTGATGITVYRGDAFPPEYHGNLFVADCGSNLVHRKVLEPDGISWKAMRAEEEREFLSSRDIWFRPVQLGNAPDGSLHVLDMSREVIEHPKSLPPIIKKHLDLTSGRDQGRIYRVVPEDFRQPRHPWPGDASTEELVALLGHPNCWHRETASRLIFERQDREAVAPLEALAASAERPEARVHAMYALAGLQALSADVVLGRLGDPHPRVREHAVRLAERVAGESPALREKLYQMVRDDDLRVRYQLAFSLGDDSGRAAKKALADLARRDVGNSWVRLAVISSLEAGSGEVLSKLAADGEFRASAAGKQFLQSLAELIGRQRKDDDIALLIKTLQSLDERNADATKAIIQGVTKGAAGKDKRLKERLAAATSGRADALLGELVAEARRRAADGKRDVSERVEAVRTLGIGQFDDVLPALLELIQPQQPNQVQVAALATLAQFDNPVVARHIIQAYPTLSPRLRNEALETLFSRGAWLDRLFSAIEQGEFAATNIDAARADFLRNHPDAKVRDRAARVLSKAAASSRQEIIDRYKTALELSGNADRGRTVFRKVCAACHRLENHGHEIGKDLLSVREKGPAAILHSVLDPNREVDPKYISYIAITEDGRTVTGVIAEETATSITLQRAENARDTLLRRDIEALRSTGKSIMPEGLEKEIDAQALADLIAYLTTLN